MNCPKCSVPTHQFGLEADLVFDRCENCSGMWLEKGELARTTSSPSDWIDPEKAQTGPVSKYNCPKCLKEPLHEVAFAPNQKIIVETCKQCEGLWLDSRELSQVQELLRKHRIQLKKKKLSGL